MTTKRGVWVAIATLAWLLAPAVAPAVGAVTHEEVERAIHDGVNFLKRQQNPDNGGWPDYSGAEARTGLTSLVTLALLTAGEPPDSPSIRAALAYLHRFTPEQLDSTYAVALQTMVYAMAEPEKDKLRIAANADWLERAQIKDDVPWRGSWSYHLANIGQRGDNSNSQYALLGLHAATEAGVNVKARTWALARTYWEGAQIGDGGWGYYHKSMDRQSTSSMTAAGISSLVITGMRQFQGAEKIRGANIIDCGKGSLNVNLKRGIGWLAGRFQVGQNFPQGQNWRLYYLYGIERAGRLGGVRFFGNHDWYREGAEALVSEQDKLSGSWKGMLNEDNPLISTSFVLLFLAKGRSPVLVNKLRHGPGDDWDNDPDDVRNIVNLVSMDWKHLLTWQVVDPETATVEDMLQAPIVFFNGHQAPRFSDVAVKNIRDYVDQGGFIVADACCGREEFDAGFRKLMKQVFPEPEYQLKPLSSDHPVWRAKHLIAPDSYPLWGVEHGCRTVVIYSPKDLSCYWNQMDRSDGAGLNPHVTLASNVGQNIIDYATGRELPADKLVVREVHEFKDDAPKRGSLRIAKLKHSGDWNVAPLAVPNLMETLRKPPFGFDVAVAQKDLAPGDPNLVYYPLIYFHGRAAASFTPEDMDALRKHVDPGGGTIFADAACGSPGFDASFRRFVAELFPDKPLVPIPKDDELFTKEVGMDLKDCQYTKAAGGGVDYPQLEGVKINGHWSIIYSKYDIGCALERNSGLDCKGYSYESALRIAANIVIYATLP